MLTLCCLNIVSMFTQHCGNIGILVKIQCWYNRHTLPERSVNTGQIRTLGFWSKYNVGTTFTQGCLNVVSMLTNIGQSSHNVVATLRFWNRLEQHPHNIAGMFKSIYKWTLQQRLFLGRNKADRYFFVKINIYFNDLMVMQPRKQESQLPHFAVCSLLIQTWFTVMAPMKFYENSFTSTDTHLLSALQCLWSPITVNLPISPPVSRCNNEPVACP